MSTIGANDIGSHWALEPGIAYLNHGSFGACPRAVLDAQTAFRRQLEREPVRFFVREYEGLLDDARHQLAVFVGASPADLALVPNATCAVNTVLHSLKLGPGDELLVTDHAYSACSNALAHVAADTGARVVCASLPFPIGSTDCAIQAILNKVSGRTRLALVDHVTSPTALVLPIEAIVEALGARGVDTLVDGAHAPGMMALDLTALGAAYYAGNCHKWMCAPKGAGFLHVRADRQEAVHPLVIGGARAYATARSRYQAQFDWTGTLDPTPYLCLPEAIRFMGSLLPGGWNALIARNRAAALKGRDLLATAFNTCVAAESMTGAMAAVELPKGFPEAMALHDTLLDQYRIEVPIVAWEGSRKLVRISAQVYNTESDYEKLVEALQRIRAKGADSAPIGFGHSGRMNARQQ